MKDDDALTKIIGFLIIGIFLLYLVILALSVVVEIGGVLGVILGGYESIKNYFLSFKENIITSNKQTQFA